MYGTEHLYNHLLDAANSWWIYGIWLAVIVSPKLLTINTGLAGFRFGSSLFEKARLRRHVNRNNVVALYRRLPLRTMSRAWGKFNDLELPTWSRKPLLSIYVKMFGCNVAEAAVEDLTFYRNLGEFFKRGLKPGVRPVDQEHRLVMPSDGKILNFGKVTDGVIEQVKGVNYSLKGFFGPQNQWIYKDPVIASLSDLEIEKKLRETDSEIHQISDNKYYSSMLQNSENQLYHIVIYLAPGDYHRFHSPAEWTVEHRRHFPGELLSVNPMIAKWVHGLFNMNERAVYTGKWKHGFFSMTAVGATNVGSIKTYFDKDLETNLHRHTGKEMIYDDLPFPQGVSMRKGEPFGEFNLGSTIVLVFEAPKTYDFSDISLNQTVKMGEPLGDKLTGKEKRSASARA